MFYEKLLETDKEFINLDCNESFDIKITGNDVKLFVDDERLGSIQKIELVAEVNKKPRLKLDLATLTSNHVYKVVPLNIIFKK